MIFHFLDKQTFSDKKGKLPRKNDFRKSFYAVLALIFLFLQFPFIASFGNFFSK